MDTLNALRSSQRRSMRGWYVLMLAIAVAGLVGYVVSSGSVRATAQGRQSGSLQGLASMTGLVDAAKPFKAAQVYIRNVDKKILYMVYTAGGKFKAVALLPGNYEVNVQAR